MADKRRLKWILTLRIQLQRLEHAHLGKASCRLLILGTYVHTYEVGKMVHQTQQQNRGFFQSFRRARLEDG